MTNSRRVALRISVGVPVLWLAGVEGAHTAKPQAAGRSATIHWQRVPLREAVARLETVFGEAVFVDRRVDPTQRVSLDIEASSVNDVLGAIATPRGLGVSRLGSLVYLGPRSAAEQLRPLAGLRRADVARLPASRRATLERGRPLHWPRLAEPRNIVTSLVEQRGWRVAQAQKIPHDLWAAGGLPELTVAEQLTVLLVGFDLTFEVSERALAIVPLDAAVLESAAGRAKPQAEVGPHTAQKAGAGRVQGTKQVYTLRVVERPVRVVLEELVRRLKWQIEIDEAAIRAAGRTVDKRVSFAVQNVEQGELLDALLGPAGLGFRREGERITVVPRKSN